MRLNYKRLGDYIEPCNEKNDGNVIKTLQGISNRKYFQKAKTNTIGVDLSKYRVVRTGQFAFNRATTRNGDKISIALRKGKDCIVSPSYRIFKSKDENILNSEYLMMWFKRPDFDRYARFKSHGSAHEFFDWEEMQEVELPIPPIEKQNEIVAEYNTIVNRIKLNEQLNQKLEDTAQALYKHWFVDFEFPNADGKPYKSSGGEMNYNEELDMEIPEGWKVEKLERVIEFKNEKKKPNIKGEFSVYGGNGIIDFVNNYNAESVIIVGRVGAYCGSVYLEYNKCWVSDNAISGYSINDELTYCLYLLQSLNISERREGTGQPLITQSLLNEIQFIFTSKKIRELFNSKAEIIQMNIKNKILEIEKLRNIESLLLSKMSKTA